MKKINSKYNNLILGLFYLIIGICLTILKQDIISILLTVVGVFIIVYGILFIARDKEVAKGIVAIVIGALVITFGWLLISIVLYVIAALLILYGAYSLYLRFKHKVRFNNVLGMIIYYAIPIAIIIVGGALLFNQGSTVAACFIVSGIFMIVVGVLYLIDYIQKQ